MLARPRCLPYDEGTDFRCCFYRNQGAEGWVHPAVSRDECSVPRLSVLSSASNDGICISVMTITLVLLPRAGGEGPHSCTFLDPLNARSQLRSLFAWPFTVGFQGLLSAPTPLQRCIRCADAKTVGDKSTFIRGFLTHPAVLPSASCIQLTDLQLSQEQMISLFSLLNPPFTPKGLGISTGPNRHGVHRSIWQHVPSCQRESKLAGACLSPSPAPMSRSSL